GNLISNTSNNDAGTGNNALLTFTASNDGDYYISAGADSNYTGTYTLNISDITEEDDTDDYSQDETTTGAIAVGDSVSGEIETAYDEDWFKISLDAGQQIQIDLEGSPTSQGTLADPYLSGVYNDSGSLVTGWDDDSGTGRNAQLNFTATDAGDYFISTGGFSNYTGTYTLSATDCTITDDYSAGISTAGTVTAGTPVTGDIEEGNDTDWFAISLLAGQQIQIDLEGSATSKGTLVDTFIAGIFNSSGELISNTSDDDSGAGWNASLAFTASSDDTYYIAAGAFGSNTGTYTLSATDITLGDDYSADTATDGTLFVDSFTTGTIESANDQDWFKVNLTAGQQIRFDLEGASTSQGTLIDTYIHGLYGSNGDLILNTSNDDGGEGRNAKLEYLVDASGDYYLAAGAYADDTGTYRLTVTDTASSDDYASSIFTKGALNIGSSIMGEIEIFGDQDWFKVSLNEDQAVQINLEGSILNKGTLSDTVLFGIYDSTGTLISDTSSDDDGYGTNSMLEFAAPSTGDYYISAAAFDTYTGSYTLSVMELDNVISLTGVQQSVDNGIFI
ncbi:MAG: hypothetical protein GY729_00505, partial [Desulfobacteraceae bacterium]|nr:hypothetical protein [Desulfobacteraceae bacterium]